MKPEFREAADVDYRDALQWYRNRDLEIALRFAAEVGRTVALIDQSPGLGGPVPEVDDPATRRLPVRGFPYHVVFVKLQSRVEIVAVAHNRRKPGYWL